MRFKVIMAAIALFAMKTYAISQDPVQQNSHLVEIARQAVAEMAKTLKGELQSVIAQSGPANAIQVCRDKAPEIAKSAGRRYGLMVDRTSLKPRRRAPDAWEKQVLMEFERRKASGEPVSALEFFEVIKDEGLPAFRYMKAIETKPVCLACHGEQLTPEIEQTLKELYPDDQAKGFKVGDIRRAFTVVVPLQNNPASP